jgi:TRAP-type C4-dicarboxylate transport system substrate-binding protein
MKNYKRLLAALMALCLAVGVLAGCGDKGGTPANDLTPAVSEDGTYSTPLLTMKFNCIYTANDANYIQWENYFKALEEATKGAVKVEMYASESLGTTSDTIEQAAQGEPIIANTDVAYLGNYVADFSIGNAPYVFQEAGDIRNFWESSYVQDMEKELGETYGLKILHLGYFGTRNAITNTEVHSRADFGKLKIRCAATPMWNEVVRVLGANAVNTAWSETYSACSQGVADGAESPYSLLYSSKLYECCPYIIETNHLYAVTNPVMSYSLFKSLPQDVQDAIDSFSHDYCPTQVQEVVDAADVYKQLLADEGVTFIDIDKSEFIAAAAETPDHFPEWTEGMYDQIVAYLNSVR